MNHGTIRNISTLAQFNNFWNDIENILKGLHYNNMQLFKDIETGSLKLYTSQIVKALHVDMVEIQQSLEEVELSKDANTSRLNNLCNIVDDSTEGIIDNKMEIDCMQKIIDSVCTIIDNNKDITEDYRKNCSEKLKDVQTSLQYLNDIVENDNEKQSLDILLLRKDIHRNNEHLSILQENQDEALEEHKEIKETQDEVQKEQKELKETQEEIQKRTKRNQRNTRRSAERTKRNQRNTRRSAERTKKNERNARRSSERTKRNKRNTRRSAERTKKK